MSSGCCTRVIVQRTRARLLRQQSSTGIIGTGVAGQIAIWATPTTLDGDTGLAWDAANKELDVSGPGTNNAVVYADATDASGAALWGRAAAGGDGATGSTTTGRGVFGSASASGGKAGVFNAGHTGAVGIEVNMQSGATVPGVQVAEAAVLWQQLLGTGGVVLAGAVLATSATKGFVYVPTCNGVPTGTPVAHTGTIPLVLNTATTPPTLYVYAAGSWQAAGGGGGSSVSFADQEIPSGTINGSNTAFTLAHTPVSGSVHVYQNRTALLGTGGADYSVSGTTLTMGTAPATGDSLWVDYRY